MAKFPSKSTVVAAASAASAIAAAAYEFEHRHVSRADLSEAHVRIRRLWDLRAETENLAGIGQGLLSEWGPSAFLGFEDIAEMAAKAGQTIFVAQRTLDDGETQTAVLQTIHTDANGDPEKLRELHPSFADLTSTEAWNHSAHKGGDTVVLLQITTLGKQERGGGLGSLLRNAALHMQPEAVKFALTTTPVDKDPSGSFDIADPSTHTPAMRFHIRGGAEPTTILPGYKTPPEDHANEAKHASDVVVMRYARGEDGIWPAARPEMRIHHAGPVQERLTLAWRRLKRLPRRAAHRRQKKAAA